MAVFISPRQALSPSYNELWLILNSLIYLFIPIFFFSDQILEPRKYYYARRINDISRYRGALLGRVKF